MLYRCFSVLLYTWTNCGPYWWWWNHTPPFLCWTVRPSMIDVYVLCNAQSILPHAGIKCIRCHEEESVKFGSTYRIWWGLVVVWLSWLSTGGSSQRCPGLDSKQLPTFSLSLFHHNYFIIYVLCKLCCERENFLRLGLLYCLYEHFHSFPHQHDSIFSHTPEIKVVLCIFAQTWWKISRTSFYQWRFHSDLTNWDKCVWHWYTHYLVSTVSGHLHKDCNSTKYFCE